MKRIAIFRRCGLGDAVQMTPLLQQVRADLPDASIEVFINDNAAPILERSPCVDRVWRLPPGEMDQKRWDPLLFRMWRRVWAAGDFDVFLYLDVAWQRSALLRWMPAKIRAGLESSNRKLWQPFQVSMRIPADLELDHVHASEVYVRLWQKLTGYRDRGFGYDVRHLTDAVDPLPGHIVLAPGAADGIPGGRIKRWPATHWQSLAHHLLAAGKTPVFLGREDEFSKALIPQGSINLLGRLKILETVRYLSRCEAVVGNDSGLYQIALGLGVPSVGLFGPTSPKATGPFRAPHGLALHAQLPCVPCCKLQCHLQGAEYDDQDRPICMNRLTPEEVAEATLTFLANRSHAQNELIDSFCDLHNRASTPALRTP